MCFQKKKIVPVHIQKNNLFDCFTDNANGYFTSCAAMKKCPRVFPVKPSNNEFIVILLYSLFRPTPTTTYGK